MNRKKNGKMGHKTGGIWNKLHGISFDIHSSSQADLNGSNNAASYLLDKNAKKLKAVACFEFERSRVEADRLRFKMV